MADVGLQVSHDTRRIVTRLQRDYEVPESVAIEVALAASVRGIGPDYLTDEMLLEMLKEIIQRMLDERKLEDRSGFTPDQLLEAIFNDLTIETNLKLWDELSRKRPGVS
jgi:hypothetical protein